MIYLGSDHAGLALKDEIQKYLKAQNQKVIDLGVFAAEPPSDYPDIAHEVAEKVRENNGAPSTTFRGKVVLGARGILVCGTGVGMCMTANKTPGIRAAVCESEKTVEMSRRHNDANVLCIGGRVIQPELAKKLVDIFLKTPFENEERHLRRVQKIDNR